MDLDRFQDYLDRKMRAGTAKDYLQRLKFVYSEVSEFAPESINSWLLSRRRSGVQGNSLNCLVKAVRAYCAALKLDWGQEVLYFTEEESNKEIFSDEEIEAFLALPRPPRFQKERWEMWTMFFSILAFSGMRANEVASLTIDQVDFGSNNFLLPITKTRPRMVPIAHNLRQMLPAYLAKRTNYLFPCDRGPLPHIWRNGWQKNFLIRKRMLGIKRLKLTTHSFRHSHATNLYDNGASLADIMKIEGHKRYDTTLKYVHLSNRMVQRTINKHSIVRKSMSDLDKVKELVEVAQKMGIFDDKDLRFTLKPGYLAVWAKDAVKESITLETS